MKWHRALALSMCLIMLTILVPVDTIAEDDAGTVNPEQSDQFVQVSLFLKEGKKLDATAFDETDTTDHVVTCPDGYVGDGLFGHGIVHRVGHVYWMKVGKWESESLGAQFTIQAPITYSIYVSSKSSTKGDFAFNMLVDGKYVNNNKDPGNWTQADNVQIDSTPTLVKVEEKKINMSAKPISGGDTFGFEIWCRLSGDVKLHYGSFKYPSALSFKANSIVMKDIIVTPKKITFTYTDAFNVPVSTMLVYMSVDDSVYDVNPTSTFSGGYPAIVWKLGDAIAPGAHTIKVVIGYDPKQNNTYEFTKDVVIKEKANPISIPSPIIWTLEILLVIVLGIVAYRWYDNRKLEKLMEEEGLYNYYQSDEGQEGL